MIPFYEIQPSDMKIIHNTREIKYRSHFHEQAELIYVFRRGQHINIEGTDYEIMENQAAIIFPHTMHTYFREQARDTEQIFVIFSARLFGHLLPDIKDVRADSPIITDVDEICRTGFKELLSCVDYAQQLAWTLLLCSRLLKKISITHIKSMPVTNLIEKIIQYISSHFYEDISLDTLASEFNVSKYYISHIFSDKIKISLPSYLALTRAEYAAGLIRTSSDTITNICHNSGFSSQSTFNRAFKKIYKMTPREYRDNINTLYKD